ncbi:hypothetical protein AXG93_3468s1070 [Marchantia polymorpha subsp. ruderalis]|uniref:Uncharacterized protein n=1 Tax=Marchantia polymorpha subsp. ruderalis TaxID=1480154 RepID=A0A176WH65_MARPO|nr:hypothetical protein AXG93_3468s1070 [Marchantia polymorpha subsp. ruderalis]
MYVVGMGCLQCAAASEDHKGVHVGSECCNPLNLDICRDVILSVTRDARDEMELVNADPGCHHSQSADSVDEGGPKLVGQIDLERSTPRRNGGPERNTRNAPRPGEDRHGFRPQRACRITAWWKGPRVWVPRPAFGFGLTTHLSNIGSPLHDKIDENFWVGRSQGNAKVHTSSKFSDSDSGHFHTQDFVFFNSPKGLSRSLTFATSTNIQPYNLMNLRNALWVT